MFLLLMVPVVALVAAVHRTLQRNAPSNVLAARVRSGRARLGTAVRLAALSVVLIVGGHLLALLAETSGPGWLNLVVLIAMWDAIKFGLLAIAVILRCAGVALRGAAHRRQLLVEP